MDSKTIFYQFGQGTRAPLFFLILPQLSILPYCAFLPFALHKSSLFYGQLRTTGNEDVWARNTIKKSPSFSLKNTWVLAICSTLLIEILPHKNFFSRGLKTGQNNFIQCCTKSIVARCKPQLYTLAPLSLDHRSVETLKIVNANSFEYFY